MERNPQQVLFAFSFTIAILLLGYISFGIWTTLVFVSGFLGGFLLWLFIQVRPPFKQFKTAFWLTFILFLLHRIEEKVFGFFDKLAQITSAPKPGTFSLSIILLILMSVGAWLLIPILVKKGYEFGYYLVWTFFAAMGITELAHFIFPLFTDQPYGYFPGMASVVVLAPAAWWGITRIIKKT